MSRRPAQLYLPDQHPGMANLPPPVQQACRALGLSEPPLAYHQTPTGGWVIIAADGRKLCWQPEGRQ